jgi:hypothetical protein
MLNQPMITNRQQTGGIAGLTAAIVLVVGGVAVMTSVHAQAPAAVPTFSKDIAPILYKNCVTCHRPGEIAPMSLLTFEDARPYAKAIRDEVVEGHMPPWHADPAHGTFLNERRLTEADKQTIVRWANGGSPKGDPKDLPPIPSFPEGWTIGRPDAVFSMPAEYEVPAEGVVEYQYFEVPTNFTADKWIQAIEIRPGTRRVVHHVLVYAREPGPSTRPNVLKLRSDLDIPRRAPAEGQPRRQPRRLGSLIATTAPGTNAMIFRPGTALQIKAGAVLTFQVHYTTDGEAAKDRSNVGMIFAKEPPAQEIRSYHFINGQLAIPAGAADHRVGSEVGFTQDVTVWGLFPHTHLRGKSWEYRLVLPDGRSRVILSVPRYDFNWQTYYMFAEPLKVPAGGRIEATAVYDNSAANRSNPDAKVEVRWGDQTWEEMQYTGITYSVDGK